MGNSAELSPLAKLFAPGVWGPQKKAAVTPPPAPDIGKVPPDIPVEDWHHQFGYSTEAEAKALVSMLAPFGVTGPVEPDMQGGFSLILGDYREFEVIPPNSPDHHNVGLLLLKLDRYGAAGWIMIRNDVLGM